MKALYTAVATASGDGRNGHVSTDDGLVDADLKLPVALGGPGGATNPEQLFASGYSACFLSALKTVARASKADLTGATVQARVSIGATDAGGFQLAVELDVAVPALDRETARTLVERAHEVCPYSHATRGNIDVALQLV